MSGSVPTMVVWAMVGVAVAAALLGALAFLRVRSPLERLHAGSFVTVLSGVPLAVAGFASKGVTGQTLKLAAIVVVLMLAGALGNHAIARALLYRGGARR